MHFGLEMKFTSDLPIFGAMSYHTFELDVPVNRVSNTDKLYFESIFIANFIQSLIPF